MNDADVMPLITKALSTYPMYVPENEVVKQIIPTREELNEKLLNHYKWYEIGFETIARFLDELEIAMNEIMPYYVQQYKTVETMFTLDNIFENVDMEETFREQRTGTATANEVANTTNSSTGSSTATANDSSETHGDMTSHDKKLETETPQGNIAKTETQIDDVSHADKASWNKATSSTNGNSSSESSSSAESSSEGSTTANTEHTSETTNVVEYTHRRKGNQGIQTFGHDMKQFRETIIDVTVKIIENRKIKELFMQVF